MNKFKYIDALRGYAIFFVIFGHTGQMYPLEYPAFLKNFINFGPRGVELFFIVSALTLFLTTKKRFVTDKKPLLSFFIRRFFRIAPLFYFGFILYSIILNENRGSLELSGIIGYLSFLSSLNPELHNLSLVPGGWSISTEMIFYLFIPFLIKRIRNIDQAFVFTIASTVMVTLLKFLFDKYSFGFDNSLWQSYYSYCFIFYVPVFAIGMCFYFLIFENNKFTNQSHQLILLSILLLGNILVSGFLTKYILIFIFGMFALYLSKSNNSIVVNKVFCFFGKISYSMYISHFVVLMAIERYLKFYFFDNTVLTFVAKLILALLLTSVISIFLYHFIENTFQNIGKKIIGKLNQINPITN